METGLAILMAFGIFVGIPIVIGFGIVGAVILAARIRMAYKARGRQAVAKVTEANIGVS